MTIWKRPSKGEPPSAFPGKKFFSAFEVALVEPLIIRPAAAAEIDEASLWYEAQRTGLREEFLAEVNGALDTIGEMPEIYAVVHRDTRRAMLVRFPYSLLYRLVNNEVIVVACFHGKRDPRRWQGRT